MKFRYTDHSILSYIRDSLWEYPYKAIELYNDSKVYGNVFILLLFTISLILGYNEIQSLVEQGKGYNNTLRIGIVDKSSSYNPLLNTKLDRFVNKLVFDKLFTLNSENTPSPAIASSWNTEDDNLTLDVTLNMKVKWQDGYPLNADDIIYSFNLQKKVNPNAPISKMIIKKIDNNKISITKPKIDPNLWENIYWPIFPAHTASEVGTGPYIYSKTDGNRVYLTRNTKYYKGEPNIKDIIIEIFDNDEDLSSAFDNGYINVLESFDPQTTILNNLNDKTYYYSRTLLNTSNELLFNVNKLKDPNVRKAINYAINKEKINSVLNNNAFILDGPINSLSWAYSNDKGINRYTYSKDSAINSFKQAGFTLLNGSLVNSDNSQLTLNIAYNKDYTQSKVLASIKDDLTDIGINVILTEYKNADWSKKVLKERDYQIAYTAIQASVDPDPSGLWSSSSSINISGFSNKAIDRELESATSTTDQATRKSIYERFQHDLMSDPPAVFLYSPNITINAKPNIQNIKIDDKIAFEEDTLNNIELWKFK